MDERWEGNIESKRAEGGKVLSLHGFRKRDSRFEVLKKNGGKK